jgi:hypothetical protein
MTGPGAMGAAIGVTEAGAAGTGPGIGKADNGGRANRHKRWLLRGFVPGAAGNGSRRAERFITMPLY